MRYLRTNTACRVTVGPFIDKTDGVTPETALTVTSCKLTMSVDDSNVPTLVLDASATASGGNNDMVHITGDDAGFYDLELTAANLNYLGRAILSINDAATHCPVFHEFMIVPAMIYDSLFLGTGDLNVNISKINSSTSGVAGFSNAANTITVGTIGAASTTTNIVTSSLTPAAAVTDQFKGLILAFANDTTTANLRGQKTDITGSTSGGVLTVTPLTTAPVSGDTFVIQ